MITGVFDVAARSRRHIAQAVLSGQHQVEHDQVDLSVPQQPVHRLRVPRAVDAVTVLPEITPGEVADLAVVVDDQDVGRGGHAPTIGGRPAAETEFCYRRLPRAVP